jgi:signal transduction histidine kinase
MIHLSLRSRLLASYFLLLAITLGVISLTLLIVLSAQPAPAILSYQRLAAVAQGLTVRSLTGVNARRLESDLAEFAQNANVRVLLVNLSEQFVTYDSDAAFPDDANLVVRVEAYSAPRLQQLLPARYEVIFGAFDNPDGGEWLFTGLATPRLIDGDFIALLLAEPRPTQTLQDALSDFTRALGMPMLQAGVAGLVVAFGLAYLISRSIAQPLQAVANAASGVALGHFDQSVPVSGPPEVRSVAEAFNRMSAEVRANQEAQRDFLANVSHDLKTPLTSIQGYSQAIVDGTAPDSAQAASIIYDEAGRLNRMVIELTDLARIQAGRLSMQSAAIDMGQIAAAIGQRLSVVAQKKGITLRVEADAMPHIAGDGDRLAQVMTNLISNAIKYTPSGGSVWVKTQIAQNGVEVIVKDTGVGIPQDDLPRIFERFYQVDKTRGPKRGTGLGLAITAEIVQAHGGRISVFSDGPGNGSTFTVWLPSPHLTTVVRARR